MLKTKNETSPVDNKPYPDQPAEDSGIAMNGNGLTGGDQMVDDEPEYDIYDD